MKFNKAQQLAIDTLEGPILILAGAGAGKTRVITNRLANMVNKGIDPQNILAVTFTNKATNEMKNRVKKLVRYKSDLNITTFHSLGKKLIEEFIDETDYREDFSIISDYEAYVMLQSILERNSIPLIDNKFFIKMFGKKGKSSPIKELLKTFQQMRVSSYTFNNAEEKEYITKIFTLFREYLKENNFVDLLDLLTVPLELLGKPKILHTLQERYKYIMVDEYQDTDNLQYEIINLIADKYRNICVVGDENQSIYGFRGANVQNILNFEKHYPDAKRIVLGINYRSTKTIVNASNDMIAHNPNSFKKGIVSARNNGSKIIYEEVKDDTVEAETVVTKIKENLKNGQNENAILYRTNKQSFLFENELKKNGISYVVKGDTIFIKRKEIKRVLDILRVVNDPENRIALYNALNNVGKKIEQKYVDAIFNAKEKKNLSLFKAIEFIVKKIPDMTSKRKFSVLKTADNLKYIMSLKDKKSIVELIDIIQEKFGFKEIIVKRFKFPEDALENIEELKRIAKKVEMENNENNILLFLDKLKDFEKKEEKNAVQLMTIHSSKGLEFENVFIVGFEEESIPMIKFDSYDEINERVEEERRLFYVALTRAKNNVCLIRRKEIFKYSGDSEPTITSRFLKEIPEQYITKKGSKFPHSEDFYFEIL